MKIGTRLFCALTAALITVSAAGCKKGGSSAGEAPKTIQDGLTQMQASLGTASPAAQSLFYQKVQTAYRYDTYADGIAALEQMQADPSLNEQQKKLAGDLITLFKAKMQGTAAPK
jgi:hypothetical protein